MVDPVQKQSCNLYYTLTFRYLHLNKTSFQICINKFLMSNLVKEP